MQNIHRRKTRNGFLILILACMFSLCACEMLEQRHENTLSSSLVDYLYANEAEALENPTHEKSMLPQFYPA